VVHSTEELRQILEDGKFPVMVLCNPEMSDFALVDVSREFTEEMKADLRKRNITVIAGVSAIVQGKAEAAFNAPIPEETARELGEQYMLHIAQRIGPVANA
jgi:hypothetical protein